MKNLEKLHNKALNSSTGVKYYKRLKQFKSSNFKFDLESQNATSYGWWDLLSMQNGKLVFNTYVYSNSTSRHINKLYRIVNALGLKPIYVNCSTNIRELYWQKQYIKDLTNDMLDAELFLSRKKKKDYYLRMIKENKNKIEMIKKIFGVELTKNEIDQIKKYLIASDNARREEKRLDRIERKKKIDALKPKIKVFDAIDLHDANKTNDLSEITF